MAVVLLILKIIGIILLLLLGLLVLVLALVLFVPVRYRIGGEIEEELSVHISVTWLLHLVSFRSIYADGELNSILRICGIRRKGKKEADAGLDEEEPPEETAETREPEKPAASQEPEEPPEREETEASQEPEKPPERAVSQEAKKPPEEVVVSQEPAASQRTEEPQGAAKRTKRSREPSKESWAARIASRVRGFFEGIRTKIEAIKSSVCSIKEKLGGIKGFLADENNKIVLPAIWAEVKYLLCHFKFRRIKTDLSFSLGDPALTGQALGALSVLPFLYQYEMQLFPDFVSEETYVRGVFEIKGYARGVHLLRSVIRLIRKKEFRLWLKRLLDR